ncbi:MAG: hypothetical protein NVSMB64_32380 [Candidatus Velthaea sp.]
MTDERDPHLAASIAAAFNVLSTMTGIRARVATYVVIDEAGRRVVTLSEFRRALAGCKRLEVTRGETDGDVYVCLL